MFLPSYWWKRLFGAVVDKVEAVDTKVTGVSTKVNNLSEQVTGIDASVAKIVVVEWDNMESTTTANNKEAYTLIRYCLENNKPVAVVVWNTLEGFANPHHVAKSFNIGNELDGTVAVWIRFIAESTDDHSKFLVFKLTEDGTLNVNKIENIYDDFLSDFSTNAVQNKVISSELEQLGTRIDSVLRTRDIYFVDPEHNATLENYRVENNKSIVSDSSWRDKLQVNIICKDNTYRCLILSAEKEYGELILYVAKESRTEILEGNRVLFHDYALSHIYKVVVHSDGTCTAEKRLIDIAWNMQDNEEVIAVALNDLNSRLEKLDEKIASAITNTLNIPV